MEDKASGDILPLVPYHTTPTTGCRMTPREIHALQSCKHDIRTCIQPVVIASTLHRYGLLKDSLYSSIMCMFTQDIARECISDFLIANLSYCVNLERFVHVLDECGYRKLACHIFLRYITGGLSYVHKSTSGQRPLVHKFFRNLKRMVHDAQFENPRLALRQLAERFIDQMENETNQTRRQLLADKCIAIIGAEIDAIAITFDTQLHEHDVFKQMKELVTETSNTSITDVVYLGRLANANSIAGNFNNSEDILVEARCRAYNTGPCLELVNMLYIEVYVKHWEFEKYPTEELRKQLMMWGRVGLESLENEDVDTKTLWRRMFILRMVFCLIGLGNRANIIENCSIDEECLSQAGDLLSDIDRSWYGIEARRKMFYFVARARLSELKGHLVECIEYIKEARKLANEGHFEEFIFIVEYYERIIKRTKNQRVIQNHTCQTENLILLRKETDSCSNDDMYACILAATDETRNFVLLRTLSETSFSSEDRYHVYNETTSCHFPISRQSIYSPVAFDESRNLLLLKSLEVEIHPDNRPNERNIGSVTIFDDMQNEPSQNERNIRSVSIFDETQQGHLKQCVYKRDQVLLHSTQECPPFVSDNDLESPSFHPTSGMKLHLCPTTPQITFENQLVLTDLQNPSHNYVLIHSDISNLEESKFDMLPENEEFLTGKLPLRLCLSSSVQNISEIESGINSVQGNSTSCNQRLNIPFGESDAGSTDMYNESAELSDLIPANAYQGLPRYYMLQPGTRTESDCLLGERQEPSGCSKSNVSDIIQTRRCGMDKPHVETLSLGNQEQVNENRENDCVEENEGRNAQEWSFQSDDMFGD